MNCGVCRPFCGKCKPPMEKPLLCGNCGTYTFRKKAVDNKCKKCGAELPKPDIKVVHCLNSDMLCANPCGRSIILPYDGITHHCMLNTAPPSTYIHNK